MSRLINYIVFHCSATKEGQDLDIDFIRRVHTDPKQVGENKYRYLTKIYSLDDLPKEVKNRRGNGWKDVGYHYVSKLDGSVQIGRLLNEQGAHVKGHNQDSIGWCYIGGLDKEGKPKDTRTPGQIQSMKAGLWTLTQKFPNAIAVGHRDFSEDKNQDGKITPDEYMKECPCFNVRLWLTGLSK